MTETNAAVAETTSSNANAANANGEKWENRFGTLKNVRKAKTRNQKDVVTGIIVGAKNTEFAFQAYNPKMIEHILAKGDGQKVELRGTVQPWEFTRKTEAGGTYKETGSMFTAIIVNTTRPAAKQAGAAADGADSASEATGTEVDAKADASLDDQIPF